MASYRAQGLTFAPEAGTQRMRDVINKNLDEEQILTACRLAFEAGWDHIKLYFMIGLPTEQDEDVLGIVDSAAKVRQIGLRYQPRGRVDVTASVSTHVPKPHTPFQWCAMDTLDEIAEYLQSIEQIAQAPDRGRLLLVAEDEYRADDHASRQRTTRYINVTLPIR